MKKILLLSDTHGHIDESILKHAAAADEIWHAGDIGSLSLSDQLSTIGKVRAVYGNIDDHTIRTVWPEHICFELEGLKVLMLHIAGYPGHYNAKAKALIRQIMPGLVVCGHSHILRVMRDPHFQHLHMNPGAAGIHGFHRIRTMLRFGIQTGKVIEPEVIELGLRGKLPEPVG